MPLRIMQLALQVVLCVAFLTGPANAATIPIFSLAPPVALVAGNDYEATTGPLSLQNGSAAFTHLYNFFVPAALSTDTYASVHLETTNVNLPRIKSMVVTWLGGGPSMTVTNASGGLITEGPLTALLSVGFHTLRITGTSFRAGRYDLTVFTPDVPLPPALVLFGTALAGLGLLGIRRRKRSSELAIP